MKAKITASFIYYRVAMVTAAVFFSTVLAAAEPAGRGPAPRPGLFFEETWQQIPGGGENPISQAHVANPALELKLYGQNHEELQILGIHGSDANPVHTWSGVCGYGCTFAFRHRDSYADLTGAARIMVLCKTTGLNKIRPFIKLADGTALVGDYEISKLNDFLYTEFPIAEVHWIAFDTETGLTRGNLLDDVDLGRVDEIGFTDLQPGSGHGTSGWADVAVIRVYADAVPR